MLVSMKANKGNKECIPVCKTNTVEVMGLNLTSVWGWGLKKIFLVLVLFVVKFGILKVKLLGDKLNYTTPHLL